jgi:hypothetical protein
MSQVERRWKRLRQLRVISLQRWCGKRRLRNRCPKNIIIIKIGFTGGLTMMMLLTTNNGRRTWQILVPLAGMDGGGDGLTSIVPSKRCDPA